MFLTPILIIIFTHTEELFSLLSFHSFISSTDDKHMLCARSLGLVETPVALSSQDRVELRSHTAEPDSKAFFWGGGGGGGDAIFPCSLRFQLFLLWMCFVC